MKQLLLIMFSLSSLNAFAAEYYCENSSDQKLTYTLKEIGMNRFELEVSKKIIDPMACDSRWGCDYLNTIIYKDTLEAQDIQGAMVFESRRIYITMENMDEVSYEYTTRDGNGVFTKKHAVLSCY